MGKLIFGMMQSLDGYVAGVANGPTLTTPGPELHRYFENQVRRLAGSLLGRRMYEVMRYWDEDQTDWGPVERDFAQVWRPHRKWVVSRSLKSVGPNATLVSDGLPELVRKLKSDFAEDFDVSGPELAASLSAHGLIDEYHLYLQPVVLGKGKPFFAGPRPALRFAAFDRICGDTIRLKYVPA